MSLLFTTSFCLKIVSWAVLENSINLYFVHLPWSFGKRQLFDVLNRQSSSLSIFKDVWKLGNWNLPVSTQSWFSLCIKSYQIFIQLTMVAATSKMIEMFAIDVQNLLIFHKLWILLFLTIYVLTQCFVCKNAYIAVRVISPIYFVYNMHYFGGISLLFLALNDW